jgi:protein SCO1/2
MRFIPFVLALCVLLPGCTSSEAISFHGTAMNGQTAPSFTLESADGNLWTLNETTGKSVVIVFMFTRCDETCPIIEHNIKYTLDRLGESEKSKLEVVAITMDYRYDSPQVLTDYMNEFNYTWPHLTGSKSALQSVWTSYGIVPVEYDDNNSQGYDIAHQQETFILDKNLKLQVRWSGADWPLDLFMEDLQTVIKM